ncbi:DUF4365 domain-containing protein [Aquisphaera giovannonii]|uniref:DUF4365 domain-containing protein n=1 Tax=Aquisphaera giovannonii TaxID=406548 RepID=UPI0036F3FADC
MRVYSPRVLVVLYLPISPSRWLEHVEGSLVMRGSAYWVSLRGAPASDNRSSRTFRIPRHQVLSVEGLTGLMTRASRREEILYESRIAGAGPGKSREDAGH